MTETSAYLYLTQLITFTGNILTSNFIFGFSFFQFFFFSTVIALLLRIIVRGNK